MKFGVVVFPGSNCDNDCFHVVKNVLEQEAVFLWHQDRDLQHCDGVIIPGGFSYGDYLRTGAIARFSPVMESIRHFAEEGGLVMGICNGFQILVESHLLPGALLPNSVAHFVCRKVALRVENIHTPFTTLFYPGEVIHIPIAHHQGNYYTSPETLSELEAQKRIPFRYCTEKGDTDERS
ncbi:MAG: phosphoribosylformylglycinamidine synthase subunit PurQ, partial [Candidatus Atribacteria bacterium]|nr:phosphoribosylformylglycinamidine synthase subunit PurQ [Candidatus Atribacteria bacterium]